jgi:hypothetical protein
MLQNVWNAPVHYILKIIDGSGKKECNIFAIYRRIVFSGKPVTANTRKIIAGCRFEIFVHLVFIGVEIVIQNHINTVGIHVLFINLDE